MRVRDNREMCPQSGDFAPANLDPTGYFECNHCGKLLQATAKGYVRKHRLPEADEVLTAVEGLAQENVRFQAAYATERGVERHTKGGPTDD